MKVIIFKFLAILIALGGFGISVMETKPLILIGFFAVAVIIYELAEIIDSTRK